MLHNRWVPKKRIRPRRSDAAMPLCSHGDRLLEPAGRVEHPCPVGVGPADVVDDVHRLGDRERRIEIGERAFDVAGDAAVHAARVQGMALDVPGADRASQINASSASGRDSANRPPSIRIWARPATTRARAAVGGSAGMRSIAAR